MKQGNVRFERKLSGLLLLLLLAAMMCLPAAAVGQRIPMWIGQTYRIEVPDMSNPRFVSQNEKVASVDSSGLVYARGSGTAIIKISSSSGSRIVYVDVSIPSLSQTSVRMDDDAQQQLYLSGNTSQLGGGTISWSSSNPSAATVSGSGLVRGVKEGSTVISANLFGYSYRCNVTVIATKKVESLELSDYSISLVERNSKRLTVKIRPSDLQSLASQVTWRSSNSNVASVSGGTVKAVNAGSATITASLQGKSASCQVTVTPNYEITNANQLLAISGKRGTYYLTSDINLGNTTRKINNLSCTLDGRGHKLTVSDNSYLAETITGTVKNLTVSGGGLAKTNRGTVTKCTAVGTIRVKSKDQVTWGLVMENRGTISQCTAKRKVIVSTGGNAKKGIGNVDISGIAKSNYSVIERCSNKGKLSATRSCGGLVLGNYATIRDCVNTAQLSGRRSGGIACTNNGKLTNCLSMGKVKSAFVVKGNGSRLDCYYRKAVTADRGGNKNKVRVYGLTGDQLTNNLSYPSLNFAGIWSMGRLWPVLNED